MTDNNSTFVPNVLLKRVGPNWHAVGLEHAVCAWSPKLDDVVEKFYEALAVEMAYGMRHGRDSGKPLEGVRPAPSSIWREFEQARLYMELDAVPVIVEVGDEKVQVPRPDSVKVVYKEAA